MEARATVISTEGRKLSEHEYLLNLIDHNADSAEIHFAQLSFPAIDHCDHDSGSGPGGIRVFRSADDGEWCANNPALDGF